MSFLLVVKLMPLVFYTFYWHFAQKERDKKNISDIACDVQAIIVFKHHIGF